MAALAESNQNYLKLSMVKNTAKVPLVTAFFNHNFPAILIYRIAFKEPIWSLFKFTLLQILKVSLSKEIR